MRQLKRKIDEDIAALDCASSLLLGVRYERNPLGEGPGAPVCQKPLFRFDAFDCLTFVNTVLAWLNAANCVEFCFHIRQLNYYSGNVRYENRYHFMSADWNPENIRNGYICDLTERIVDRNHYRVCEYAATWINKPEWLRRQKFDQHTARSLAVQKRVQEGVQVCTPYIPLTCLFDPHGETINPAIWAQFPSAGIVEIVRPNWDLRDTIGTHLNISHLGFIVRRDKTLLFRHAASPPIAHVTEEPLVHYLRRYLSSTTVKGIAVFRPIMRTSGVNTIPWYK